jgi:hypothetical protein
MTPMTIAFASDYVPPRVKRRLEIFALRCFDYADDVAAGKMHFLDAVDVLQDSAIASGLVDLVGMDVIQCVLATAFATARRRP